MPEIAPMSYFEAAAFARKNQLMMKAIKPNGEATRIYFQKPGLRIHFFEKLASGNYEYIYEPILDYFPELYQCLFVPSGKLRKDLENEYTQYNIRTGTISKRYFGHDIMKLKHKNNKR